MMMMVSFVYVSCLLKQLKTRQANFYNLIFIFQRGAFSTVRRCVQKSTGLEFAAKVINTKKLAQRGKKYRTKFNLLLLHIKN